MSRFDVYLLQKTDRQATWIYERPIIKQMINKIRRIQENFSFLKKSNVLKSYIDKIKNQIKSDF